ncbi:endonuclease/exonuclease/phosphatase family protein [Micromonospora sp. SL4-19]|uniref:endonuclease/exonuclease/phosphatase family protein n=1 Tax=Micromonospora sp. SL4-19 TaxID=3399129 RepID=UPI003A4D2867
MATGHPASRGTGIRRHLAKFAVPVLVGVLVAHLGPSTARASGNDDQGKHTGQVARVMTRNLFLGADLAPALSATSLNAFVDANGAVLRQTTATNFPTRAKGLAAEILEKEPDLVGLQEVALWRTGPASVNPLFGGPKTATTVRYDFLQILLSHLNAGKERYRPVAIQEEFDFEAPANENGVRGDGPAATPDAELNGRLTMRDVILARVDGGVHTYSPSGGTFQHLLTLPILGVPVTVTRGWTQVDAKVRGGDRFRFVNTHLEAFDPRTLHPSIRALQAGELVAPGGPATGDLPVVLLGDFNSDDDTVVPDDQQAYRVLLGAGFVERSTADPLSCCLHSYDLTTGTAAEFDHQVDHVMTDSPRTVRLVESSVTGRTKQNGYWDSDHAGVFSALRIG